MQRIAVSITESQNEISPNLELCEYVLLVDYENHKVEKTLKVRNPFKNNNEINKLAGFIKDQKTSTILTGKLDNSLVSNLETQGIKVVQGDLGEANIVIKEFISNN